MTNNFIYHEKKEKSKTPNLLTTKFFKKPKWQSVEMAVCGKQYPPRQSVIKKWVETEDYF